MARHLSTSGLRVVAVLVDPESFGGDAGIAQVAAELEVSGIIPLLVRRGGNWADIFERSAARAPSWA